MKCIKKDGYEKVFLHTFHDPPFEFLPSYGVFHASNDPPFYTYDS